MAEVVTTMADINAASSLLATPFAPAGADIHTLNLVAEGASDAPSADAI